MKTIKLLMLLLLTTSTLFAQFIEIEDKHGHRLYQRVEDAKIKFVSTPTYEKCGDFLLYEGNYYATVSIGTQCWFKENLNVGTRINSTTSGGQEMHNETPAIIEKYCYNNEESNCDVYGGFYEWDEAMQYVTTEGTQGICPIDWHIPTYSEMLTLQTYVGSNQATKLIDENARSGHSYTNETGFSTLFTGCRTYTNRNFIYLSNNASFWSSTINIPNTSHDLYLNYYQNTLYLISHNKNYGFSVRCLKD